MNLMRVLIVHNRYRERGGEDAVFEKEAELLRAGGHTVITHEASNSSIRTWLDRVLVAVQTPFSISQYFKFRRVLRACRPDVVHVHNFFPVLSPSIFVACNHERIPVVFTAHNFRILCPTATLFFNGEISERSLREGPWWALKEKVYRRSHIGTLFLVLMVALCRQPWFWRRYVQRILVLTDFAHDIFSAAGIAPELLRVKPNFVDIRSPGVAHAPSAAFIYVGRLGEEKGIDILLNAVPKVSREMTMRIIGDGPLRSRLIDQKKIEWLGYKPNDEIGGYLEGCTALVFPSVCYEGLPLVILEAFAAGKPVIASRLGAMQSLIEHGITGLLFDPGSAESLASTLEWAIEHPEEMRSMGLAARNRAGSAFSPQSSYEKLLEVYQSAGAGT